MPRTGLHIDLQGRDKLYEAVFSQIFGCLKARRMGGDRRHIYNLVYTYYGQKPEGIPEYQEQLQVIVLNLRSACRTLIKDVPVNGWKYVEIQQMLLTLKYIEHHEEVYPVIQNLWAILNS